MSKSKWMSFRVEDRIKRKLFSDSSRNGYPSASAYLVELIEKGLPPKMKPGSISIEDRLRAVDKKVDTLILQGNETASIKKRVAVIYRIVGYLLARSFFIKPGSISEREMADANSFIEGEVKKLEKKFRKD